ncbi:hypothetical protein LTR85_006813 [Meristemomyces frigidus]|nr:hypothetical protein LTR85_006813 [Meristemomyces frigidus]
MQYGPQTSAAATTEPDNRCSNESLLFKLPGELRNRIYREVLVERQRIVIGGTGIAEPLLLLASKEIRNEAITIFYTENAFRVTVQDYNSDPCLPVTRMIRRVEEEHRITVKCCCTSCRAWLNPNWPNLIQWLQRYHGGSVLQDISPPERLLQRPVETSTSLLVPGGMFRIVDGMVGKDCEEVKAVLLHQRFILRRLDERWAVED